MDIKSGKYYLSSYDSRLGGDYCEIYNDNLDRIDIIKGKNSVDGLTEISRRHTIDSFLYETEPLNDEFVILKKRDDLATIAAASSFIKQRHRTL